MSWCSLLSAQENIITGIGCLIANEFAGLSVFIFMSSGSMRLLITSLRIHSNQHSRIYCLCFEVRNGRSNFEINADVDIFAN